MRVGFLQNAPLFGRVDQNLAHVSKRLRRIKTDLIVLPEFFATGYQFVSKKEVAELSELIPGGKTSRRLIEWARSRKMWIVAGLPERAGQVFYNSAVIVGPKGYIGTYRKAHLFDEEKRWFKPGNTGYRVFQVGRIRLGVMICFDWIFPEAARSLALAGADIIAHPANLVLPYAPDAMVTRCIENRVFAVTANRIGSESRGGKQKLTYIGQSEVVDPKGRILVRASARQEMVRVVRIEPRQARNKRIGPRNHLFRDRRIALFRETSSMGRM